MDNNELKEALKNRRPVIAWWPTTGELEYERVYKIVYGIDDEDNITVSAELLDKNGKSVLITNPEHVQYKLAPT